MMELRWLLKDLDIENKIFYNSTMGFYSKEKFMILILLKIYSKLEFLV